MNTSECSDCATLSISVLMVSHFVSEEKEEVNAPIMLLIELLCDDVDTLPDSLCLVASASSILAISVSLQAFSFPSSGVREVASDGNNGKSSGTSPALSIALKTDAFFNGLM
eukprot:CAMPEP_0196162236 /NCGR_PEP_ID=MMETSP0910-20130528/47732_1 /TAXON_ID=49265 /ORGANISM="Thalassiosira rotula, Strain GSO102" /LENGTH=111 /DNA_ID=CAMNT_0041427181 /DNA_START=505 /DNA_END=837 /DNA_ORIENTATION=+